ncbi:hypothetical protein LSAT2_016133 [Lamellibrachia satsuma]|nr:hypothetical protein LSAT2_016133 [Lamellibrachia satsuma]
MLCTCEKELSIEGHSCALRPLTTFPLNIRCEMNCRTPASSRQKLGLMAKCDDCAVSSNYSYTWHVNTIINWHDDTGTGRNARTLTINPKVLPVNQTFIFSVTVRGERCSRKEAKATFTTYTTSPPTRGNCSIEPQVGVASETVFGVTCDGFSDVAYEPLTYTFYFKKVNANEGTFIAKFLGSGKTPTFNKTLPVGNKENNYIAVIEVRVRNSAGETNHVDIPIKILPVQQLKEASFQQMADMFDMSESGRNSTMQILLDAGRIQDALSLISSAASAVRHTSTVESSRSMERGRTEFYRKIVSVLKSVNVSDVAGVNLKLQCLNDVTDFDDDLSDKAKLDAITMYEDMASLLRQLTEQPDDNYASNGTSELITHAERAIFVGSLNILKKSKGEEDATEVATGVIYDIEDSYAIKRRAVAKGIVEKTMNIINIVSKVALAGLVAGEKAKVLKFDYFSLGLQKDTAYHLSNALIALPASGYNGIKLPTLYGYSLNMSASDCANVIVFQSSNNLYTWGASARNVSTGNVGLMIANDKYNRIYAKGPITISIPVKPADARSYIDVTFDVQNRKFGRRDIRHFTTSVERNKMFRMTFSLLDAESTATLLLVLKKDTYSRVNDFFGEPDSGPPAALYLLDFGHRRRTMIVSTMSLIGFTSSVTETNNTTVIVSGIVTHGPPTSRLFIGLLPAFYDSDQCQSCEKESTSCGFCHKMVNLKSIRGSPQHVHLAVSTRMLDCLYWNSLREVWTNTACKVYLDANPGYIVCECRHLSSFAGNMLVAPNKVDLFDLKMFLGVFQNPLVVSLLIAFWCMFMIATVWARRKDGKDSVKANMVVLMDNEDKSDYYYLSDDDIDIVHHSITIKWEHIVIGLQSLAITMACNGVAIWLFRSDRPRIIYTGSRLPLSRLHSNHAVDDTHNHQDHQLQPMTKKLKHRHVWLYYVAWFLTVSSSVVATFVTAEYSLTYGYSASVKWAISFFSTFIENIIILQPLKVSALAAVVSYFFGSKAGPASPADYYVKLANDKEYVSAMERVHNFRRLPSKHMYQLPEPIVIERASRSLVKVEKMWHTLHDTVIAVSLLALVFIIAYGSTNRWSFYINKSIQDTFVKGRYSKDIGLTEVQTYNDVWWYAKYTLLPSFHHNGTTYLSDEANILIGSAIIRQIRVDPNSRRYKAPPNPSSQKSYDSHAEDQTSYRRTWKKPIRQDSVTNPYSAWTYQSADTLQMGPITCRHRTYQGSGYVVVIRANRKRMMRLFQDLEDEQWLNTNTRAVLVQFTTFNPTTSLFTISLLAFEFTNVGVVEPYHDIKTCGLYSWTNKRDVFTIICHHFVFKSIVLENEYLKAVGELCIL